MNNCGSNRKIDINQRRDVTADGIRRGMIFMKKLPELEYLGLPPGKRKLYDIGMFFSELPANILKLLKKIPEGIGKFFGSIGKFFAEIGHAFADGDIKTKLSFFIMGFGQFFRRQIGRGIIFLLMEVIFIAFICN